MRDITDGAFLPHLMRASEVQLDDVDRLAVNWEPQGTY
jgi:hypothetical protein